MNMQEIGYFLFMEEQEKQQREEVNVELDERLLATPTIAIERCYVLTMEMAEAAKK